MPLFCNFAFIAHCIVMAVIIIIIVDQQKRIVGKHEHDDEVKMTIGY